MERLNNFKDTKNYADYYFEIPNSHNETGTPRQTDYKTTEAFKLWV